MQLKGSCHCGAVRFSLFSAHPYPYQRCYCSICRKTQGGGGYAINLAGDSRTMENRRDAARRKLGADVFPNLPLLTILICNDPPASANAPYC